ncbi:cysteine proteinase inhibitor A-like [Olea europaea var. sylvestris]|uniref:cysteine proteinase inhibitor A-like n=1 Tax=Olea europaea var. sylvestris TaxID=158386 RepID=UPI000C1D1156|nr:cysteine proteinase inhibitor A-like [Olea europaea var. sylvestris]
MAATTTSGGIKLREDLEEEPIVGGIHPIERFENSLEIECLARFAVDEYNIKQNALVLEFKKVLDAKHQVVAGFIYYLTLEVFDRVEKKKKQCETKVWIKIRDSKELLEFKFVGDA